MTDCDVQTTSTPSEVEDSGSPGHELSDLGPPAIEKWWPVIRAAGIKGE
jgi:hypothetical protein